jgi:diguanylate cyclase (GGDEF)-like protein/PAS domain S-box-containing protein
MAALGKLSGVTAGVLYLPGAGLSLYLLMRFGVGYAPLIVAADLLLRALFPDIALSRLPETNVLPWTATLSLAIVKTICYVGATVVLQHLFRVSAALRSSRELSLFLVVAGGVTPYLIGTYTTTVLINGGIYPATSFNAEFQNIWLAYANGIVAGYPLLIYFIEPLVSEGKIGLQLPAHWSWLEVVAQYTLLAVVLVYALHAYLDATSSNPIYLVLPIFPLSWLALKRGLFAAGFACIGVAVTTVAYIRLADPSVSLPLETEIQRFMLFNSLVAFAFAAVSSERAEVERRLDRTEWALEQARESSLVMTAELSTAGVLHNASRQLRELFGIAEMDMDKHSLLDIVHVEEQGTVETALSEVASQADSIERTVRLKNAAGDWVWVDLVLTAARGLDGKVESILTFLRDITSQKRAEEVLARNAYYDHLTGLANRLHIEESLCEAIERGKREGTTLAVLFIDLDKFKQINDTFGHAAGDKVLVETARRLKRSIRTSDIAARLGGDEFVVVLQNIHPVSRFGSPVLAKAAAHQRASKILIELQAPFVVSATQQLLNGSIGISILGDDAHDAASLLKHADAAMYHAKQAGQGGIEFFSRSSQQIVT